MEKMRRSFFKFDSLALLIGFIVDLITLSTILLSFLGFRVKGLHLVVSPSFAFALWVLSAYTYLAFLHTFWEKHLHEKQYADKFSVFLIDEVFVHFREPWLLLPVLLLVFALYVIAGAVDDQEHSLVTLLTISLLVGVPMGLYAAYSWVKGEPFLEDNARLEMEKQWEALSEYIRVKIQGRIWLEAEDLSSFALSYNLSSQAITYALARYAVEYPDEAEYGYVYDKESGKSVSGCSKVLINLTDFPYDRLYYSSTLNLAACL